MFAGQCSRCAAIVMFLIAVSSSRGEILGRQGSSDATTTGDDSGIKTVYASPTVQRLVGTDGSVYTTTMYPTDAASSSTASGTVSATSSATSDASSNSTSKGTNFCLPANYSKAPFCSPEEDSRWVKGRTYQVTWDSSFYPGVSDVIIALLREGDEDDEVLTQSDKLSASAGFWGLKINSKWLDGKDNQTVYLKMVPQTGMSIALAGLLSSTGTSLPSESTSFEIAKDEDPGAQKKAEAAQLRHNKDVKAAIAVPLCVVGVVILCGFFFWFNRSRRGVPVFKTRKTKGYGSGKSKLQRMGGSGLDYTGEYELNSYRDFEEPPKDRYTDNPQSKRA